MTKVEKIEDAVQKLTGVELAAFREWFQHFDAEEWDRQIEADLRAGKLDKLAGDAVADYEAGKAREI